MASQYGNACSGPVATATARRSLYPISDAHQNSRAFVSISVMSGPSSPACVLLAHSVAASMSWHPTPSLAAAALLRGTLTIVIRQLPLDAAHGLLFLLRGLLYMYLLGGYPKNQHMQGVFLRSPSIFRNTFSLPHGKLKY